MGTVPWRGGLPQASLCRRFTWLPRYISQLLESPKKVDMEDVKQKYA